MSRNFELPFNQFIKCIRSQINQLDSILKFDEKTMKMLYLFLWLFALQLSLASPSMIRKEQTESGVETMSTEITKTVPQSTDPKAHPFVATEGPEAPSNAASSLGRYEANCKRNSFILLTSLEKYTYSFNP